MAEPKEVIYPTRYPRSLWQRIVDEAEANGRTIAGQIRFSVQRDLNLRSGDNDALGQHGRQSGDDGHGG